MTVNELIKQLQNEDPERIVILQGDSEGNSFSPILHMWAGAYKEYSEYDGEAKVEKLTESMRARGYTAEDVITDGVPALILTPRI
jgi:hypothetical protein